jgi:hypothetical protein
MKKYTNVTLSQRIIEAYNKKYSAVETTQSIFEVIEEKNCTYKINYCGHKIVVNKKDTQIIIN